MRRGMFRSVVTTLVLVLLTTAGVLATAGLASASLRSGHVVFTITSPIPMALTACNGNTCQVITNSGTNVTNWATSTTAPNAVCTYAEYFENDTIIAESSSTCLSAGQQANANWSDPGKFPAGTKLCTAWTGIAGRPCNTV